MRNVFKKDKKKKFLENKMDTTQATPSKRTTCGWGENREY
jgi:hypothetical protein